MLNMAADRSQYGYVSSVAQGVLPASVNYTTRGLLPLRMFT